MSRWVCVSLLFDLLVTKGKRRNSVPVDHLRHAVLPSQISIQDQLSFSASPQAVIILVNARPSVTREESTEMNATDCSSEHLCFNSTAPNQNYAFIGDFFRVLAVVMLLITCPLVILLNALVIVAIKTKRRLQTMGNILLASLAGTDLAMGLTAQPAFIASVISRLTDGSISVFGTSRLLDDIKNANFVVLCFASIIHLVLVSADRFVAMKCSLLYDTIVTKFRITVAAACSWLFPVIYVFIRFMVLPELMEKIMLGHIVVAICLLMIIYCHGSVYFICRRHLIEIKSAQPSQEATAKFLEDKKAWKTTGFIVGGVFMCYMPILLSALLFAILPVNKKILDSLFPSSFFFSFVVLNSLLNPVIYCWRCTAIRKAMLELLRKSR